VDLPAPFSPTRACTSPYFTSKSTFLSAVTPGNILVMPVILRSTLSSGISAILIVKTVIKLFVNKPVKTIFAKQYIRVGYIEYIIIYENPCQ
jgi:hypothetical protein